MLEAYQGGIKSLKNVVIDIDKVDEVMEQLEEVSQGEHLMVLAMECTGIS